jgi:hypothetical protein
MYTTPSATKIYKLNLWLHRQQAILRWLFINESFVLFCIEVSTSVPSGLEINGPNFTMRGAHFKWQEK